jgi:hypothetical protein
MEIKYTCHKCGRELATTTGKKPYYCGNCQKECEKELGNYTSNLKKKLAKMGEELGFKTQGEFTHEGSRIDFIWYIDNMILKKRNIDKVIVAGFEIETSYRTSKHIRADVLNLRLLSAGLTILILPKESFHLSGCIEKDRVGMRKAAEKTAKLLGMSNFYVWDEL